MAALERGVQIVVATPGRLTDLVERGACRMDDIEIVVLDEADRMADMGFLPVVTAFLDDCPRDGQRLLFSATLDGAVDGLVRRYLRNPATHSVASSTASVDTMSHHVLHVSADDKAEVTARVAAREGRTILFVRTKHGADRTAKSLRQRGVAAASLHGGKAQSARTKVLNGFKDGSVPVLVATDVAARGIHVDDVGLVLHVDPPADPKDYLHRSGRTARAGGTGTAVLLALPHERREVDIMTRKAGVQAQQTNVNGRYDVLTDIAGAREPSGVPLAEVIERSEPRRGGSGRSSSRRPQGAASFSSSRTSSTGRRGGTSRSSGSYSAS
jgi:superfamily II DNA/RNA helicase